MAPMNRCFFILQLAGAATALTALVAHGQTGGPKLAEADPQAAAFDYKDATTKVDTKKFPNHAAKQNCANYQLYQGKPKETAGGCPLFAGKQVAATGWGSRGTKRPLDLITARARAFR